MSRLRLLLSFALLGALCILPPLRAQVSNIAPRVVGPVDETSRITLGGSLSILAQQEFDRGEASPATQFHNVRLVIRRSPQQEAALETLMAEQLDRGSPNYHHWLTPDQFNRLYGLADSDIAAIKLWLQSHGLQVGSVTATDIAFSGSVPQIEEALRTSIHSFVTPSGREFLSNTSEPSIPAAFSNVISGVAFLNTLQPRSYAIQGPKGEYDAQAKKLVPSEPSTVHPLPNLTIGGPALFVVPADAATIYDTPNSYNAAFSTGTSYTGSGVTIGIGGDSAIQTGTVVDFRNRFLNGNTTAPTVIDVGAASGHPAQVNGDEDEAYLDNEVSGGLAPGAAIDFYVSDQATTNGIYDAIPQMLADNKVDIFSLSFGYCELYLGTSTNQEIAGWWQQAATQGITVVVSTGDSGSAGCDNQDTAQTAAAGLNVSGFSTTPYNVAVGGTDFYGLLNGGFSTYVNNNASSSNSYRSALSYIPESTWNDSTTNNGQISANIPEIGFYSAGETDIVAGAGGASNCSTNTTTYSNTGQITVGKCTSGYAKPSWQTGPGVPNDGDRDVPDVSLLAANGFYGAIWLVCTDDTGPNQSGQTVTANCTNQTDGNFYFSGIGGTSASTPAFAGILALLVQKNGGRIGLDGAKFLYNIYNSAGGAAAFHDITQGNNSVVCTSGTPNCQTVGSSFYLSGYNTTAGYDLATGLGSVDATQLIAAYGAPSGPSISLSNGGNVSVSAGASGTSTLTVTPSAGFTGQVKFGCTVGDSPAGLTCTAPSATITGASPATATLTVSTSSSTPGGIYTATVTASDAATGQITATTTLNITVAAAPQPSISLSNGGNVSVSAGTSGTSTLTVTPSDGFTGAVNFACSVSSSPAGLTCTAPSATVTGTSAATSTLTVSTSSSTPAGTYTATVTASDAATGQITATTSFSITVTQAQSSSTFSISASTPAAVTPGSGATSTITVSTSNGYSGTVTLACSLTNSPSGAVDLPSCSAGNPVTLAGSGSETTSVAVTTTAASSSSLDRRGLPGWLGPGGGTALALLVFLGIPARRRGWRNLLGLMVTLAVLGTLSACGGGGGGGGSGGGGGGGGNSIPGTSPGTYTFTVTGTGNPTVSSSITANFTLTVN